VFYLVFFVVLLVVLLFVDLSRVGCRTRELLLLSALEARLYAPAAAPACAAQESAAMGDIVRANARLRETSGSAIEKRISVKKALGRIASDSDAARKAVEGQTDEDYRLLLEYLLLKRCLLGCRDVVFRGGYTVPLLGWRLPPGLAEDLWLYVCNNHSILSCCFAASGSRYSRTLRKFSITVQHSVSFFLSNILVVVFTAAGIGSQYSQATEDPGSNLLVNTCIDVFLCTPASLLLAVLCDRLYKIRVFEGTGSSDRWNRAVSRCLSALLLVISLSSLVVVAMLTTGNNAMSNIGQYLYSVLLLTMVLDVVYAAMAFETRYYYSVTLLDGLLNPVLIGQYYLEALIRDGKMRGRDFVEVSWRPLWGSGVFVVTRVMPRPCDRPALERQGSATVEMYATYSSGDGGSGSTTVAAAATSTSTTATSTRDSMQFEAVNPLHSMSEQQQRRLTGLTALSPIMSSLSPPQRNGDAGNDDDSALGVSATQMMLEAQLGDDLFEDEEDGLGGSEEERAARRARIVAALSGDRQGVRRGSFVDKVLFFEERGGGGGGEPQEELGLSQKKRNVQSSHFVKPNPLLRATDRPSVRPRPGSSSALRTGGGDRGGGGEEREMLEP